MNPPADGARLAVAFVVDGQRFGLPIDTVERTFGAVEVTVLPSAPPVVAGVINVHGQILPVISMRRCLGLPDREVRVSDAMIVARTRSHTTALLVDSVAGVVGYTDDQVVGAAAVLPRLEKIKGVVKLDDGLVLMTDLGAFLSIDEQRMMAEATEHLGTGSSDEEN